jgi:hypothetical protein
MARKRTTAKQKAAARRNLAKARRRRRIATGVAVGSAGLSVLGTVATHSYVHTVTRGGPNRRVHSTRGVGRPLHTPRAVTGHRVRALTSR